MLKNSCNTEITKLDNALLCHEHILALDVSVQNLSVMHMLHAQTNLSKPIQNLGLRKVSPFLVLDSLGQITTIGIVHHDAEVTFFGFVGFAESHNVGMIEDLENLCLF